MSLTQENVSAYVIMVNDDNTMSTTQKRRIVQRSKLVDDLWFLVAPEYNGYDMSEFTVLMEYLMPVSHRYRNEILRLSESTYSGYLKYLLPIDTTLTVEAGDIEIQLTFLLSDLDENGRSIQRARKITKTTIAVVPISAWSDVIPDCALSALDQRIIKMDAQIKALNETTAQIGENKADNLSYNEDSNELQLMSGNTPIGNKVVLNGSVTDEDGMPVVDFTGSGNNPGSGNTDTPGSGGTTDHPGDNTGDSGGNSGDNTGDSGGNSGDNTDDDDNSSDVIEF